VLLGSNGAGDANTDQCGDDVFWGLPTAASEAVVVDDDDDDVPWPPGGRTVITLIEAGSWNAGMQECSCAGTRQSWDSGRSPLLPGCGVGPCKIGPQMVDGALCRCDAATSRDPASSAASDGLAERRASSKWRCMRQGKLWGRGSCYPNLKSQVCCYRCRGRVDG
jgi:hypothetical protein